MFKQLVISRCWDCKFLDYDDDHKFYNCDLSTRPVTTDVMRKIPDTCKLKTVGESK